jgi:hypothetical protein
LRGTAGTDEGIEVLVELDLSDVDRRTRPVRRTDRHASVVIVPSTQPRWSTTNAKSASALSSDRSASVRVQVFVTTGNVDISSRALQRPVSARRSCCRRVRATLGVCGGAQCRNSSG